MKEILSFLNIFMSIMVKFMSIIGKFEKQNRVTFWELLKSIIGKKRSIIDSGLHIILTNACNINVKIPVFLYVTRSSKRGPFLQKSDCELDLSADSAKSVVHARENRFNASA